MLFQPLTELLIQIILVLIALHLLVRLPFNSIKMKNPAWKKDLIYAAFTIMAVTSTASLSGIYFYYTQLDLYQNLEIDKYGELDYLHPDAFKEWGLFKQEYDTCEERAVFLNSETLRKEYAEEFQDNRYEHVSKWRYPEICKLQKTFYGHFYFVFLLFVISIISLIISGLLWVNTPQTSS